MIKYLKLTAIILISIGLIGCFRGHESKQADPDIIVEPTDAELSEKVNSDQQAYDSLKDEVKSLKAEKKTVKEEILKLNNKKMNEKIDAVKERFSSLIEASEVKVDKISDEIKLKEYDRLIRQKQLELSQVNASKGLLDKERKNYADLLSAKNKEIVKIEAEIEKLKERDEIIERLERNEELYAEALIANEEVDENVGKEIIADEKKLDHINTMTNAGDLKVKVENFTDGVKAAPAAIVTAANNLQDIAKEVGEGNLASMKEAYSSAQPHIEETVTIENAKKIPGKAKEAVSKLPAFASTIFGLMWGDIVKHSKQARDHLEVMVPGTNASKAKKTDGVKGFELIENFDIDAADSPKKINKLLNDESEYNDKSIETSIKLEGDRAVALAHLETAADELVKARTALANAKGNPSEQSGLEGPVRLRTAIHKLASEMFITAQKRSSEFQKIITSHDQEIEIARNIKKYYRIEARVEAKNKSLVYANEGLSKELVDEYSELIRKSNRNLRQYRDNLKLGQSFTSQRIYLESYLGDRAGASVKKKMKKVKAKKKTKK